jgi:hypothetical protein
MVALALAASATRVRAQAAPSLADELARHRYGLTLENVELGGDGATFLLDEARASEFVLIGEDHGFAEMPRFTAALFRALEPSGYHHLVVEAGPITGRYITRMATDKDPQRAFADFNRTYPFALPFYSWREEADMLATAAAAAKGVDEPIWALDQEFILSPQVHLERLVALAPDANARAVATKYYEKVRTEVSRMVESKNPSMVFLASATADDFKRLDAAFHAAPGSEAGRILSELETSWEIYQGQFNGHGYESNTQRSALMKAHFMEYYNRALRAENAPPKAVFKFGAYHMKRGQSFINVFDVGNLASELAVANGSHSFHVLVVMAAGTQNTYLPFVGDPAAKQKPYDPIAVFDFMDVKPLLETVVKGAWTVLDVRPLRPLLAGGKLGKIDRGLEAAIFGYDAIIVVPTAHAATLFE